MGRIERFIWFVVFIALAVLITALILRTPEAPANNNEELIENIHRLEDSLNIMKIQLQQKDSSIDELKIKIQDVEKELTQNKEDYEKTNDIIINAGVDDNIRILSGYLSEEDNFSGRYFGSDNN